MCILLSVTRIPRYGHCDLNAFYTELRCIVKMNAGRYSEKTTITR